MLSISIALLLTCLCKLASAGSYVGGYIGGGIGGLIVLVLDVIAIFDVLQTNRTVLGKLLWILLIIFFPIGGLLIWCVCGRKTSSVV
ncbi:unnamed protein product [Adineta ricciae]|uniref:Cardiolipin synthase N-terminal domain-containing protein n=1 Tax=Adineta ricciae TaxID=249248 RepID=A0A816DAB0_ADIRI|nr:unnamed protein product [Adineta ricciae]